MVNKKRHAFGVRQPGAKLSDQDVREIRKLLREGLTGREVAKLFGVSVQTISNTKNGVRWKHIGGELRSMTIPASVRMSVLAMLALGNTRAVIAQHHSINISSVQRIKDNNRGTR
jgi:DNA-binding CsgD family transcriptional regulator